MGNVKEFGLSFQNLTAREFIATARRTEELGFGTFWVPEDYVHRGAFSVASAIAACTLAKARLERGRLGPDPVQIERGLRFPRNIESLGRGPLHAKGKFE